ncbi:MAG: hypothetical protein IKU03_00065 [Bacteroidales bacterium]|nr:hypothetical protein [Bacteroidales bacterium]
MNNIAKTVFLIAVMLAAFCSAQAQPRDRRADLKVRCAKHVDISSTGQLWMCDRCGHIWVADSIGACWRTVLEPKDKWWSSSSLFERVAAFGTGVAVAGGYLHQDGLVLRTTDGGNHWDSLNVGKNHVWVRGFCYHADGRLWMSTASGRGFKSLSYSADSGRTYTTLKPSFVDPKDGEDGITDLYMVNADTGLAGTYGNGLYYTTDNWRTAQRLSTPLDQGLLQKNNYQDTWLNCVRIWRKWVIVTESATVAYASFGATLDWKPMPLQVWDYEVDTVSGHLWGITENNQLVLMEDMEHWRVVRDNISPESYICGTLNGRAYLYTPDGVVRVQPNGQADTCGFFTEEKTLEQVFDETLQSDYAKYDKNLLPTFLHGDRLWRTDGSSIYLQDAEGWYRIAKPLNIREMRPDPTRTDRVVILRHNGKNYSVDANGQVEPFVYHQPLQSFVDNGLKSVEIKTYYSGCFHHEEDIIRYTSHTFGDDKLQEEENTVEEGPHTARVFSVDTLERALLQLGECYSRFPTPEDFGLREGEVDLKNVFQNNGWCTSSSNYMVTFTNWSDDKLCFYGSSDAECGDYFPWLLPMQITGQEVAFVTYQPSLWKTLRPMMPEDMKLREHLNNFVFLLPGDLLFFRSTAGMGAAIKESTGQYTHVAIVESVGDTVWIIDATPRNGVSRRPYLRSFNDIPDIYRLDDRSAVDSALFRARSFIGLPYDYAFLPDNGAFYCSELVYECFLSKYSQENRHLFEAKPMNWRNADGELPKYWKKHFKKLKMPVPEGVMGTNPTDLSRSPLLRKL